MEKASAVRWKTTIRSATPDDAENLQRLATEVHGDDFFVSALADSSRLSSRLASGEISGCVVSDPDGSLVGSVLLEKSSPTASSGYFVAFLIRPDRQHNFLGSDLLHAIIERSKEQGIQLAFADAILQHERSQRIALRHGAFPAGVSYFAPDDSAEAFRCGRRSHLYRPTVTLCFPFTLPQGRTVYLPRCYQRIAQSIYRDAGLDRNIETASVLPSASELCILETRLSEDKSEGYIEVFRLGGDTLTRVQTAFDQLCEAGARTVFADLPLELPETAAIAADLRRIGYFFCGLFFKTQSEFVVPGDFLRLQRLLDAPEQTESLNPGSEAIQGLVDFVAEDLSHARTMMARWAHTFEGYRERLIQQPSSKFSASQEVCDAWDTLLEQRGLDADAFFQWQRIRGIGDMCNMARPNFISEAEVRADGAAAVAVENLIGQAVARAREDLRLRNLVFADAKVADVRPLYCRFDGVSTPTGLKVYEYNCGAASGLHSPDLLAMLFIDTGLTDAFPARPIGSFLPFLDVLLKAYRKSSPDRNLPHVFVGATNQSCQLLPGLSASVGAFASMFRTYGWLCRLQDPAMLEIARGRLRDSADGTQVDIYFRYHDTGDEGGNLIEHAASLGLMYYANPFSAYGNKGLFELFDHPSVPWTRILAERKIETPSGEVRELVDYALKHRKNLVLKPSVGFGGRGVVLGSEVNDRAWCDAVMAALDSFSDGERYVVQQAVNAPSMRMPLAEDPSRQESQLIDRCPVVCDGRLTGYMARNSPFALISTSRGAHKLPTFVYRD